MSDYFDRVERQIVRHVEDGAPLSRLPRLALGNLALVAAVLVVVVVAGVFLAARGGHGVAPSPDSHPALTVAFTAPSNKTAAIDRSVRLLRERLHAVLPGARVARTGDGVTVTLAHAPPGARTRILSLAAPGVLGFYDWEGEVLAPNGKTVASQLPSPSPAVMNISQGNGSAAPGQLGAGCVSLRQALALARKAGARWPLRTEVIGGLKLRVPLLYTVLQAAPTHPGGQTDGFFVLRINQSVLTGGDITNPRPSVDPNTRTPVVTFGFTASGRRGFQQMTARLARRGSSVSGLGQTLNQHFAIVLDNRLISVPFIDYKIYPDGINGELGADISGNFTTQSARDLAVILRYGPLPVILTAAG